MTRGIRDRLDRLAERVANLHPYMADAVLAERIAALEARANEGDADAAQRFERVRAILDRAHERMVARGRP